MTTKTKVKSQKTAQNMEELIKKYGIEVKKYSMGQLIEGVIVSLRPSRILVDIGSKAEGIVKKEEMKDSENSYKKLKVGDATLVMVVKEENKQGYVELSLRRAENERRWRDFQRMFNSKTPFEVNVLQYNKGGLICDAFGMQGFVPISHLDRVHFAEVSTAASGSERDIAQRMEPLIGRSLKVIIIELDREQNRLVLSEKQVDSGEIKKKREKRLGEIKVGDIIKGLVSGVVPFGLFVDLDGLEGLVHVSEIAWEKVENPIDYYSVGDEIKAQVLDIDEKKGKVGLSVKRLKPNPWETVAERYLENTKVKGVVSRVVPFGAFVQIEPGLEGLVHISEMTDPLKEGEKVEAIVTLVDAKEQRLGLSIRQLEAPQIYK